jgi:hypothetical protein
MSEDTPVNTGVVVWPGPDSAYFTVREMQIKLHRWAGEDSSRRFGDLMNLVYDPAFLVHAWERVSGNKGARTAGVDRATAGRHHLPGHLQDPREHGDRHNVLHGQWDWMRDPAIHSTTWEWDFATPADMWQHSHNVVHHTYTNVLGKDRDIGYSALWVSPKQQWHPIYLTQPIYNAILAAFFE